MVQRLVEAVPTVGAAVEIPMILSKRLDGNQMMRLS